MVKQYAIRNNLAFTLVEILVAMAVCTVIILGVTQSGLLSSRITKVSAQTIDFNGLASLISAQASNPNNSELCSKIFNPKSSIQLPNVGYLQSQGLLIPSSSNVGVNIPLSLNPSISGNTSDVTPLSFSSNAYSPNTSLLLDSSGTAINGAVYQLQMKIVDNSCLNPGAVGTPPIQPPCLGSLTLSMYRDVIQSSFPKQLGLSVKSQIIGALSFTIDASKKLASCGPGNQALGWQTMAGCQQITPSLGNGANFTDLSCPPGQYLTNLKLLRTGSYNLNTPAGCSIGTPGCSSGNTYQQYTITGASCCPVLMN
jgi:type II secretory pathway pseudopilin PulG